jgi:hypothetical protein
METERPTSVIDPPSLETQKSAAPQNHFLISTKNPVIKKVGRPRIYADTTARQRAYYDRKQEKETSLPLEARLEAADQRRAAARARKRKSRSDQRAANAAAEAAFSLEEQILEVLRDHNDSRGRLPGEFNNFENIEAILAAEERSLHGRRVTPEGWGLDDFEQHGGEIEEMDETFIDKSFNKTQRRKKNCPASFHKFLKSRGDEVCRHCDERFEYRSVTGMESATPKT